jgi:hypothetical protein
MKFDLETLKNTLMVSLILILAFVLLKRMMAFLRRGELNESYAKLIGEGYTFLDGVLTIQAYLPEPDQILIKVEDELGKPIKEVKDQCDTAGEQVFEIDLSSSDIKGRCSFVFKSKNQETTRFFTV